MNFYRQKCGISGQTGVGDEVKRVAARLAERIVRDHEYLGDDWADRICVEIMVYEHVPATCEDEEAA